MANSACFAHSLTPFFLTAFTLMALASFSDLRLFGMALACWPQQQVTRPEVSLIAATRHVAQLLRKLATLRPAIYLQRLQITSQAGHVPGAAQNVDVSLGLFVLQERP